jgi:hypothetical protein
MQTLCSRHQLSGANNQPNIFPELLLFLSRIFCFAWSPMRNRDNLLYRISCFVSESQITLGIYWPVLCLFPTRANKFNYLE